MDALIKERFELFKENYEKVSKGFKWDGMMILINVLYYTSKNSSANCDEIKRAKELIKKKVPMFSSFNTSLKLPLAYVVIDNHFNEEVIDNVLHYYDMLKVAKLSESYRGLAAIILASNKVGDAEGVIAKANSIYSGMKENHKLITAPDDYVLGLLMSLRGLNAEESVLKMERIYQKLRDEYKEINLKNEASSYNAIQTLSHLITLYGSDEEMCVKKICKLTSLLKERHLRIGYSLELTSLGLLLNDSYDAGALAGLLVYGAEFIKGIKGFKFSPASTRLMYAAYIISFVINEGSDLGVISRNQVIAFIMEQQATLLTMMVCTNII